MSSTYLTLISFYTTNTIATASEEILKYLHSREWWWLWKVTDIVKEIFIFRNYGISNKDQIIGKAFYDSINRLRIIAHIQCLFDFKNKILQRKYPSFNIDPLYDLGWCILSQLASIHHSILYPFTKASWKFMQFPMSCIHFFHVIWWMETIERCRLHLYDYILILFGAKNNRVRNQKRIYKHIHKND